MPEKEPQFLESKEKEISLEEKSETVQEFIKNEYQRAYQENIFLGEKEKIDKERKFFSELSPSELEKNLGKKGLDVIYEAVADINLARKRISESGIKEEEIRKFIQEYDWGELPEQIRAIESSIDSYSGWILSIFDTTAREKSGEKLSECDSANKGISLGNLASGQLQKWMGEWQEYSALRKREKPLELKGFENLDSSKFNFSFELCFGIAGKELVERLIKTFPKDIFSNVRRIEYANEERIRSLGSLGKPVAEFTFSNDILIYKFSPGLDPLDLKDCIIQ
jgi:hypothetical protein